MAEIGPVKLVPQFDRNKCLLTECVSVKLSQALRLRNTNTHARRIVRMETLVEANSPAIVVRIRPV